MKPSLETFLNLEWKHLSNTFYVSRPRYFNVSYDINPWMTANLNKVDTHLAHRQWKDLCHMMQMCGATLRVIDSCLRTLPDITFVANAGSFLPAGEYSYNFHPSVFSKRERMNETNEYADQMEWYGHRLNWTIPNMFEGDGDLLRVGNKLVVGYGKRTSAEAANHLAIKYGSDVLALELIQDTFYHLDTCLFYHEHDGRKVCMYYPKAFSTFSLAALDKYLDHTFIKRILLTEAEAKHMCANAVGINNNIIMSHVPRRLGTLLLDIGFIAEASDLSEFHKSGGSAKCLTLRIPYGADPFV
jgi:N-dimethylarginine dimethylaminohydrolase